MHILHISSDYPYQSLYRQLLVHLAEVGSITQTMYVPLPRDQTPDAPTDVQITSVRVIYSHDYAGAERLLYHRRMSKIRAAIVRQVDLDAVQLVHAHYLFTTGGVALALQQAAGVRYVVTVRNTDLNVYFPYAVHLRRHGLRILEGASAIQFPSPVYRDRLLSTYVPRGLRAALARKSVVVPNGLDPFWTQNRPAPRADAKGKPSVRLLFVGALTKNKNVDAAIAATELLRTEGREAHLTVVGEGPDGQRLARHAAARPDVLSVHRPVDWDELLAFYREADVFVMPSLHETFGLVYVEAMSQGLPIIYTRGEGIDGYFPDGTVGFACNPRDPTEIASRITAILEQYPAASARARHCSEEFSWTNIAARHADVYRRALA